MKNQVNFKRGIHDKENYYVMISEKLSKDKRLNFFEIGLMVHILSNDDSYIINSTYLQKESGFGKDIFNKSMKHLSELGYIRKKRIQCGFKWFINEVPDSTLPENTPTENTTSENTPEVPDSTLPENTPTENTPLININEINSKEINNKEINTREREDHILDQKKIKDINIIDKEDQYLGPDEKIKKYFPNTYQKIFNQLKYYNFDNALQLTNGGYFDIWNPIFKQYIQQNTNEVREIPTEYCTAYPALVLDQ